MMTKNFIDEQEVEKIEMAVCLEHIMGDCYEYIVENIHNEGVRRQCRDYVRKARNHQNMLCHCLEQPQESDFNIDLKYSSYHLDLDNLSLIGVIDYACETARRKSEIYKFLHRTSPFSLQPTFNMLVGQSLEAIKFLRGEMDYQNQRRQSFRPEWIPKICCS